MDTCLVSAADAPLFSKKIVSSHLFEKQVRLHMSKNFPKWKIRSGVILEKTKLTRSEALCDSKSILFKKTRQIHRSKKCPKWVFRIGVKPKKKYSFE